MSRLARNAAAALLTLALLASCGGEKSSEATPAPVSGAAAGAQLFQQRCAICHGEAADGATPAASLYPNANLADGKWAHGGSQSEIELTIRNGAAGTPMPPFGMSLSEQEISAVATYVRTLPGHR